MLYKILGQSSAEQNKNNQNCDFLYFPNKEIEANMIGNVKPRPNDPNPDSKFDSLNLLKNKFHSISIRLAVFTTLPLWKSGIVRIFLISLDSACGVQNKTTNKFETLDAI